MCKGIDNIYEHNQMYVCILENTVLMVGSMAKNGNRKS